MCRISNARITILPNYIDDSSSNKNNDTVKNLKHPVDAPAKKKCHLNGNRLKRVNMHSAQYNKKYTVCFNISVTIFSVSVTIFCVHVVFNYTCIHTIQTSCKICNCYWSGNESKMYVRVCGVKTVAVDVDSLLETPNKYAGKILD